MDLIHYTQAKVRVEYPLFVNNQLKGSLDYLLQYQNQFLVLEAKNADLQRSFTQLEVELIALETWLSTDSPTIIRCCFNGQYLAIGILHARSQQILQYINLYRVPNDVEDLLSILVAILSVNS